MWFDLLFLKAWLFNSLMFFKGFGSDLLHKHMIYTQLADLTDICGMDRILETPLSKRQYSSTAH